MHRPAHVGWEALLALGLAAGCSAPSARRDPAALEMIVASEPATLDPRYATDAVSLRATRLLHAGLVRMNPDTLEPVACAAKAWRWSDDRTLRIELREDAFFHSGRPLAPEDVIATLHAIAAPEVGSRHAHVVDAIASVERDGPHAVVIRLARPHATLLSDLELPILRGDEAASPPAPQGTLDGLGPYVVSATGRGIVELRPAEHSAFARPAHAVTLRTIRDENARALRLETGRTDVALNVISPALVPALASNGHLFVRDRPGSNLTYLAIEEQHAPLDRVEVRRAISRAMDRATLCATLFAGHAVPAAGLIAPANWAHADAPTLPFDPREARALLQDAEAHGGRALDRTLTLLASTERLRLDVARMTAQLLEDVGLHVRVVSLELGTLIARMNDGDFDLALLQLPEMTEPNVLRHFLHSSFVPPVGANRGRVADPVLDAALDAGDREIEPSERRRIYRDVEAREREQVHIVPLWYEDQVAITSARAEAFVPSVEGRWLGLADVP